MTFTRRARYIFWITRDLARRQSRQLFIGFIVGFVISVFFWQFSPLFIRIFFHPIDRIGIIGNYRTDQLPLTVQTKISEGLTSIKIDGSAGPGVAMWWEASDSGKFYVFHLNPEARWHDGNPVVASDINYNIKNVTFIINNDQTISASLDFPYSAFPILVSKPLFKNGLVGTGEYRVSSIQMKGDTVDRLTLIPTEIESSKSEIIYTFYQTEQQAIIAYQLGQIDQIHDIANPTALINWGSTKIEENMKYNRIVSILFNTKRGPFDQRSFRQALGYALPGFSQQVALSPIPYNSWAFSDKVKHYQPDKVQAQKLFDSLKLSSESSKLTLITFSPYLDSAQTIANAWSSVGIETTVKIENSIPDNFQVLLTAIDVPPDPDQYILWHSTQSQNGSNVTGYANVKIDKLLEDGRQEMDPENRKKIYADFARRLVDDAPALFLYYPKTYTVRRK